MSGGYVLKFSDSTFSDFFSSVAKINIDDEKYHEYGGSKAKRMRSFFKQESNRTVALVLSELVKLIPLQNPEYSKELLDQLKETVKKLIPNGTSKTRDHDIVVNESIWSRNKVRIFISHRDSYKKEAHALGERLNNFGFSCFVAHDTIEPMLHWKSVIEDALNTMDGMICFLTKDYYESTWTNQEIGFALARNVPIFQYCHEKVDPQGFRMDIQAIRQGEEKLKSILISDFNTHSTIRENILSEFLSAKDGSFIGAKRQFINLLQIGLNDEDIEKIVETINGPAKYINQLSVLLGDDPLTGEHRQMYSGSEQTYKELLVNKILNAHSSKKYIISNFKIVKDIPF